MLKTKSIKLWEVIDLNEFQYFMLFLLIFLLNNKKTKGENLMKRKTNYKEKGITLIALAITIIILLILAGVTLATAIRTKWIISKGKISIR